MKHLTSRLLSALMALVLVFSLFSGIIPAADAQNVSYVTGNADGFSNVIANWGSRGTTATFLSQNAEAFYADNNTSYAELSALSGSSSISGTPSSALYRELQSLMKSNHDTITSYNETRDLYRFTDCQNSDRSSISSFYSGKSIGPYWDGGDTWNREHTWPNSKGLGGSDENDIMMLRPTSKSENSSRGNTAYGESSGYFDPNTVGGYNLHGDVARIMLYTYVRWGNTSYMWGSGGVMESKSVLLRWMEEDPVDTWELGRNDSVESITGTRNVFVDYPELAFLLFDEPVPYMTTPSGMAAATGGHTVTVTVNDTAGGSVSVSGSTIHATANTGYSITGYTVVSGEATVTRDGDLFTVTASSDCTVQINFAPRDAVTLRFYENGTLAESRGAYVGDAAKLPGQTVSVPDGFRFLGWVTAKLDATEVQPAVVYAAGSTASVSGTTDYYALYSCVDSEGGATGSVFNLYSGELTEGSYVIYYADSKPGFMQATDADNSGRIDYAEITVSGNTVENPDAELVWYIAPTSDGYWTLYNAENGVYAASTGGKNKSKLVTTVGDNAKWAVTGTQTYDFANLLNDTNGVNKLLRKNNEYGFACYASATGGALTLYKAGSGTVYYTTTANLCAHGNTASVAQQDATCTEAGFTVGVYCGDCDSYISGHETIPALGHGYEAVVTPPTATEGGYTTHTCSRCGDSYVDSHTEPLGESYTVSFSVPAGVSPVASMSCNRTGITLPDAQAPEGYTFLGWAAEAVDNSTQLPQYLAAGSSYVAQADTKLYALYRYAVGGTGGVTWELVTDVSALTPGTKLLLAYNQEETAAGEMYQKYLLPVETSFSADLTQVQVGDGVVTFTLGGTAGAWTLENSSGQLLGITGAKRLAWDSGTTTWSISVASNGDATVASTESSYGRFMYNVSAPRFNVYTSDVSTTMVLPQLYAKTGSDGTTHYTTVISGSADRFSVAGVNLALNNDITLYLYLMAENYDASYTLEIVKSYADGSSVTKTVAATDWENYYGTMYRVGFNGIAAKEMTDEITVTVYDASGNAVSNEFVTTVADAAVLVYKSEANARSFTMMADLLNYGAAAQGNFRYNTDDLANTRLTAEQAAYASARFDMSTVTGKASGTAGAMGATLYLDTNIQHNFIFDAAVVDSTMTAKVSYTDYKGNAKSFTIPGSEFTANGSMITVNVSALTPADVNVPVTVQIVDANGAAVCSLTDSIAWYCVRAQASATNDLFIELMEFATSCNAYFG